MNLRTVGSICSGIEAASVAWQPLGFEFEWFSEIADFPSRLLREKYSSVPNLGDMYGIPEALKSKRVSAPDIICGGTPCQAFSLAGWKNGLNDDRGNLTLKFVDIIEENDKVRLLEGKERTVVLWENVEGVLTDKTNAFGCLVSSLAGLDEAICERKWPSSGIIFGKKRNVAWRVLDAKYFGVPQQRRRLYVIAGGTTFHPETVLFERHVRDFQSYPSSELRFEKNGHEFEVFREYTDCVYSAYGTKWNGNAAAFNGSLFVVQDGRIRRFSPLETERLMGFPDGYTDLPGAKRTNRYQAVGNSWAIPVIRWLGKRLKNPENCVLDLDSCEMPFEIRKRQVDGTCVYIRLGENVVEVRSDFCLNCSPIPEECEFSNMKNVVSPNAPEDIYISPVGCFGIIRRKCERNVRINQQLEKSLLKTASQMQYDEIERKSRVQHRGRPSIMFPTAARSLLRLDELEAEPQLSLFK